MARRTTGRGTDPPMDPPSLDPEFIYRCIFYLVGTSAILTLCELLSTNTAITITLELLWIVIIFPERAQLLGPLFKNIKRLTGIATKSD